LSIRQEPNQTFVSPPIIQSPTRNPNFSDVLGTASLAQIPSTAILTHLGVSLTSQMFSPGGNFFIAPFDIEQESTTSNNHQWVTPRDGTLRNFFVRVAANNLTTATTTLQVMNLTTAGTIDITVDANGGAETVSNTTDTLAVSAGDLINFEITVAAGGANSITLRSFGVECLVG